MKSFDYIRPKSLEEAGSYLSHDKKISILGGGASLFLQIQNHGALPDIVLDVKSLPGFHDIRYHHNHGLKLGAAVPLQHLATGLEIRRHYPLMNQVAQKLGSPQVRNRATIGGTLAWPSPVSELAAAMLCYDAVCHIWSPNGGRNLPVAELYSPEGGVALAKEELITHVHLPSFPTRTYGVYRRQTVRHDGRRMIAGVAALAIRKHHNLTHWRIAVLGVDNRPKRIPQAEALLEGMPSEQDVAQALQAVQDNINPQDVSYAKASYRRAVLDALLERAIHAILENIQEP